MELSAQVNQSDIWMLNPKALQLHSSDFEKWMARQTSQYFALGVASRSIPVTMPTKPKDKGPAWQKAQRKKGRK